MGDTETFKLVIFLNGNGCEPNLIRRWLIMLAQHWAETTTKRGQTSVTEWVTEMKESN